MKVDLTEAMLAFLADQISSGGYADESEVIRAGFRRLMDMAPSAAGAPARTGPIATFQVPRYNSGPDITLTPQMEAYMAAVVTKGLYMDPGEVVRSALRLLMIKADPAAPGRTGPIATE